MTSTGAHEVEANGRRLAAGWSSFCCILALHCRIPFIITLEMLDWSLQHTVGIFVSNILEIACDNLHICITIASMIFHCAQSSQILDAEGWQRQLERCLVGLKLFLQ